MSDMHNESDEGVERLIRAELARSHAAARPDPAIARSLHATMRARTAATRRGALATLFAVRIPAYQALAGAMAVALLFVLLRPSPEAAAPIVREQIVHVPVRDTVYVPAQQSPVIASSGAPARATSRDEGRSHARRDDDRRSGNGVARRDDEPSRALATRSPRRTKDSSISKPDVERPNPFGGLDNVQLLAHQRRGVTLAEDTAYRRFTFAIN
jgi:hypothetical protein